MNLAFRLHQIRVGGWQLALRKSMRKLIAKLRSPQSINRSLNTASTLDVDDCAPLRTLLRSGDLEHMRPHLDLLLECSEHYLHHRFPIAGVGWMSCGHSAEVPGIGGFRYKQEAFPYELDAEGEWLSHVLNAPNVRESRRVWKLIEQPHEAIDWQRDFRSGYTWAEGMPTELVSGANGKGVDPKTPWDLGRLHMLLHIATAHALSSDAVLRKRLYAGFREITLDFICQNPPGFGIQWKSPMDVAIRCANLLFARDILASSCSIDPEFDAVMSRSAHEHARYVLRHLEWSDGMRANHYLANLAGLSVAAAYLPEGVYRTEICQLLRDSLLRESLYQFLDDGGNFEASLPYHRLSAEMLLWSLCFCEVNPELNELLDDQQLRAQLQQVVEFSVNSCSSTAQIVQIGDNDSGRFLPLLPFHWTTRDSDRPHDVRHLLNLCQAFGPTKSVSNDTGDFSLARSLRSRLGSVQPQPIISLSRQKSFYAAPDFGLWRLTKTDFEVFLRAGSIGQLGKGGHAHNDQLSLALFVGGHELFCDSGTYVYTPLPDQRNRFRSTAQHSCLQLDDVEQNSWMSGSSEMLFWLSSDRAMPELVQADEQSWQAQHVGYGVKCLRKVECSESQIQIEDQCDTDAPKTIRFHCRPECVVSQLDAHTIRIERHGASVQLQCSDEDIHVVESVYAPEYGAILASRCLEIRSRRRVVQSRITVVKAGV